MARDVEGQMNRLRLIQTVGLGTKLGPFNVPGHSCSMGSARVQARTTDISERADADLGSQFFDPNAHGDISSIPCVCG